MQLLMLPKDVPQRAGHEEIFLDQSKCPPRLDRIAGIEDFGNVFGSDFLFNSFEIVSGIEDLDIEFGGGLGGIQPQVVHRFSAISCDGNVVRYPKDYLPVQPHRVVVSEQILTMFDAAVERNDTLFFRSGDGQWTCLGYPTIRLFLLIAVFDILLEQAVLVENAVSVTWNAECGHGIKKTGGKPAQTAISEGGIRTAQNDIIDPESDGCKRLATGIIDTQVDHVAFQQATDQKFHGKIIYHLGVQLFVAILGGDHAFDEAVPDTMRQCIENVLNARIFQALAQIISNMPADGPSQAVGIVFQRCRSGTSFHDRPPGCSNRRYDVTTSLHSQGAPNSY